MMEMEPRLDSPVQSPKEPDTRAIALDTLQTLNEFTVYLAEASRKVGRLFAGHAQTEVLHEAHQEMVKLVDGIGTFHESILASREALGIPADSESALLEADFRSILEDLAGFHEKNQYDYVAEMLESHLPANLEEWRLETLPKLMIAASRS